MGKVIFLVRHADYSGGGSDPAISEYGKNQALDLATKIKAEILGIDESVTIWSSSAQRAQGTAEIIKQEMQLAELVTEEKLWSDNRHYEDFDWLKEKLDGFQEGILIIVSHLEYVRGFPGKIGFGTNGAGYAQGVKIQDGQCVVF